MGGAGGNAVRAAADWHTISLPAGQVVQVDQRLSVGQVVQVDRRLSAGQV